MGRQTIPCCEEDIGRQTILPCCEEDMGRQTIPCCEEDVTIAREVRGVTRPGIVDDVVAAPLMWRERIQDCARKS
jgi:hypothetical protein